MEAPEKIYIPRLEGDETFVHEWDATKFRKYFSREIAENVEYVRTDAFIEKALKWYCLDCECNDNCKDTKCFFYREFERYLKGDSNALPPKFTGSILNEDGSTSDNWRHRHFIIKMQEYFIDKAVEWVENNLYDHYDGNDEFGVCSGFVKSEEFIENFKKAMKL